MNETKQSDGPYFAHECGCTMGYLSIDYCPKHKAAPEMYEALRAIHFDCGVKDCTACAALAKAEGKP